MRAFCYFYLVNLYGMFLWPYQVIIRLQSSFKSERPFVATGYSGFARGWLSLARLPGQYLLNSSTERVRPTNGRLLQYLPEPTCIQEIGSGADSASTVVINNSLYHLDDLDGVFLKK